MAASQQLSGAQNIRSLTDEDAIFRAFDSYPWTKDPAFMSGLNAILGDLNSPNQKGSPADMATHARIFYYARRVGVAIDFSRYQSWLFARTGHHSPPNVLPPEYLSRTTTTTTDDDNDNDTDGATLASDWQRAAPRVDLYVDRSTATAAATTGAAVGAEDAPPYPTSFADMIKLLQEGKEVPGIRKIPDTIIRDPAIKPMGARKAPRKPWEKDSTIPSQETAIATPDMVFPSEEPTSTSDEARSEKTA